MKNSFLSTILIFLAFLTFGTSVVAQSSIKIYSNFKYLNRANLFIENENTPRFHQFSLGYKYHNKKQKPKEWEIAMLSNKHQFDDGEVKQFGVHLRHEFTAYFERDIKFIKGLVFKLSPSFRLFYFDTLIDAPSQAEFLTKSKKGGINYSLFLDLEYFVTERLYIDANVSIATLTVAIDYSYVDNPILTENQKEQYPFDFDLGLWEPIFRVGVGYVVGGKDRE